MKNRVGQMIKNRALILLQQPAVIAILALLLPAAMSALPIRITPDYSSVLNKRHSKAFKLKTVW